ncbi:MAG: hypothetical protein H0X24_21680 [Ktedonobacterales bacterium]|nr:hypothetical protein [Ktedonobacterales bacterium]
MWYLIADHEERSQRRLRLLLEEEGRCCTVSRTGLATMHLLQRTPTYRIIFIAQHLPGLNGIRLLQAVSEQPALYQGRIFVLLSQEKAETLVPQLPTTSDLTLFLMHDPPNVLAIRRLMMLVEKLLDQTPLN